MATLALDLGKITGIGPLGTAADSGMTAFAVLGTTISTTLGVLTICAGLYFIFQIFSGAIAWLGSSGEKQALETAKKRISNAVIGLLLVVLSYAFISIIGLVLGFNLLDPFDALLS